MGWLLLVWKERHRKTLGLQLQQMRVGGSFVTGQASLVFILFP